MTQLLYYAGIGSRKAPSDILLLMEDIAGYLGSLGYVLRSGKAIGSDTAFEMAYIKNNYRADIWLPWIGYNKHVGIGYYPNKDHFKIAETLHPIWQRLPNYAKFLHARNVGQILGTDCKTPVKFVICWTPDGCESEKTRTTKTGGTGTAIALASRNNIPVFNLANEDALERLNKYILTHLHYPNQFNSFYDDSCKVSLPEGMIFVFGSNLAGRHGKGAALEAKQKYGAIYGQGSGLQGNAYGIPTKDENLKTLPIHDIVPYIQEFIQLTLTAEHSFYLTPFGCGLAGYEAKEIAPLIKGCKYCQIPLSWYPYLI